MINWIAVTKEEKQPPEFREILVCYNGRAGFGKMEKIANNSVYFDMKGYVIKPTHWALKSDINLPEG